MFTREKLKRENLFNKIVINRIFYNVHANVITILRLRILNEKAMLCTSTVFYIGTFIFFLLQLFTRQCHPGATKR
jgi:hypothetical protein